MSRYIDVEPLIKEVGSLEQLARKRVCDTPTNSPCYERYSTQSTEREKFMAILKAQPSADVVEVVRCKDCVHHDDCICVVCEEGDLIVCKRMSCHFPKDHYCSYGKRREE